MGQVKYDAIVINGDSYSAIDRRFPVYGHHLERELGIPVINIAFPGSSNDRITRSTIEHVSSLQQKFTNPLVIINWSYTSRQEIWYTGKNYRIKETFIDNSQFITMDWLMTEQEMTKEQKASLIFRQQQTHKQLTDFYTQLLLVSNFLENHHIDYLFLCTNIPLPNDCRSYIESLHSYKWCTKNPKFLKLTISDWGLANDTECAPTGHLSENGHKIFANFLQEIIK